VSVSKPDVDELKLRTNSKWPAPSLAVIERAADSWRFASTPTAYVRSWGGHFEQ